MTSKRITTTCTIPSEFVAFEQVTINHPNYENAFDKTWSLASRGGGARVVIVTGPTGVGKSMLSVSLLKKAQRADEQACIDDPSLVPAVLVKAIAPHSRSFSWKDFYIRTLQQLREPLIERKVWPYQQLSLLCPETNGKTGADHLDCESLRRSIELAFKKRHTRYLIVDEAHHILLCQNEKQLAFQFETLKSLADMCNATLVLVGTYDLLMIRDFSAQLIRRSQIVHLPCYRYYEAKDREIFNSVLKEFVGQLPIKMDPKLATDVSYFFIKTAGCVGILRDLLREALFQTIETGESRITREIVEEVAQPNKAIKTILEEATNGFLALEDDDFGTVEELIQKSPAVIVAERLAQQKMDQIELPGKARRKRTRGSVSVGKRHPTRDRVGGAGRVNMP